MLAPAAAGPGLELVNEVHSVARFCFSFSGRLLLLLLLFARHAAIAWVAAASALTPIAQMNPSSSRPTAVTILRFCMAGSSPLVALDCVPQRITA